MSLRPRRTKPLGGRAVPSGEWNGRGRPPRLRRAHPPQEPYAHRPPNLLLCSQENSCAPSQSSPPYASPCRSEHPAFPRDAARSPRNRASTLPPFRKSASLGSRRSQNSARRLTVFSKKLLVTFLEHPQ